MKSLDVDSRTPVREYADTSVPVTLLPVWLWFAAVAALAIAYYRFGTIAAIAVLTITVSYAVSRLRMRRSRIYAGPGWLRRGENLVQIDRLAQITFAYSVIHSSFGDIVYNVGLTDREGRTLVVPSSDLMEDSIRDLFRKALYKSVASGLTLDAKTRALVVRRLRARPASLDRAAAVYARSRRSRLA